MPDLDFVLAMKQLYSISELAEDLGITARTIRFYEDKGLIEPERAGSTRVYSHRDRGRLALILRGKRLGFSLREIREWLDLYDLETDPNQIEQMRAMRELVRKKIETLKVQRQDLQQTLTELQQIQSDVETYLGGAVPDRQVAE